MTFEQKERLSVIGLLTLFIVCGGVIALSISRRIERRTTPKAQDETAQMLQQIKTAEHGAAPIYGHAVAPGGIWSKEQLLEYYPQMHADNIQLIRLKESISTFVTYKRDGKIYWTSQPHDYPAGEAVWTDGITFVLQRCGNQIQFELPPDAVTEPSEPADLDTPQPPPTIPITISGPVTPGDPSPPVYECGEMCAYTPPSPPPNYPPMMPVCAGCFIPIIPPPPPVSTPEPPAYVLLLLGFAALVIARFGWRKF